MVDIAAMNAKLEKGSDSKSTLTEFIVGLGFNVTGLEDAERAVKAARVVNEPDVRLECLRLALANLGTAENAPDLGDWLTDVDNVTSHFADIVFDEPRGGEDE